MELSRNKFTRLLGLAVLIAFGFHLADNHSAKASGYDIVDPVQTYTYEEMVRDIKKLAAAYPGIVQYKVIGKSEYGKDIYAVGLGKGEATVYIDGSHHGREWLTTNLNMRMINVYAHFYQRNYNLDKYDVREELNKTTIWFVPMVNPDGVTLQQSGVKAFPKADHAKLIQLNGGSTNFKRWKANAKGVDLNRQYDADWANITNVAPRPGYMNYKGTAPETASETKAVVKFIYQIDPEMAYTYHSAGKILYWYFHQEGPIYTRDLSYALDIYGMTNYPLVKPTANPSGGGLSDWFVIEFNRPGFTPEIGRYPGETNLPISEFNQTWSENRLVGLFAAREGHRLYESRKPEPPAEEKLKEADLVINGKKVNLSPSAIIKNSRTLVPIRGVFEELGASIGYDNSTKTVTVRKGTTNVAVTVGSKTGYINGSPVTLDTAPILLESRTMIPLRFIIEAIGAEVKWDGSSQTVIIIYEEETEAEPKDDPKSKTEVSISIDAQQKEYTPQPFIKEGTTIVPLRDILDGYEPEFTWESGKIKVNAAGKVVHIESGSDIALLNGEEVKLGTEVITIDGNTMISLVFIIDLFDWELEWDAAAKEAAITTDSQEDINTDDEPSTKDQPEERVSISIDGQQKDYSPQPFIKEGTTIVPLRDILDGYQPEFAWDSGKIQVKVDGQVVHIESGSDIALLNGEEVKLGTEVITIDGSTMIPLVFIIDLFDWEWEWDAAAKGVAITTSPQENNTAAEESSTEDQPEESVTGDPAESAVPSENSTKENNTEQTVTEEADTSSEQVSPSTETGEISGQATETKQDDLNSESTLQPEETTTATE
ncbi:hypothetical protein FZC79_07590 [Rossellomorea vietnamensis]|uniref:Peptidase M14 domain-containing protein n=1 Tax=Rossellomorea vietnamensis TaxID=218284 RepID=A0A5D4KFE5_9BACI|nr:stalk domain-containing protein [Rossellomorea vietnamensis]TYR76007.1 hypothetical protein FZC79_07590 [Rossellomorea vietnamensis]